MTGRADSSEANGFPVNAGPDLTFNGGSDAFVAKVAPDGTSLVYAGYIGGASFDFGFGIAVDASGNAYVTGQTQSNETTFPVTVGPDTTFNGFVDAFIAKVNASGTALDYGAVLAFRREPRGRHPPAARAARLPQRRHAQRASEPRPPQPHRRQGRLRPHSWPAPAAAARHVARWPFPVRRLAGVER